MNPTQWFSVQWVCTDRQRISDLELENAARHLNEISLGAQLAAMKHTAQECLDLAKSRGHAILAGRRAVADAERRAEEAEDLAGRAGASAARWQYLLCLLLLYAVLATIVAAIGWLR